MSEREEDEEEEDCMSDAAVPQPFLPRFQVDDVSVLPGVPEVDAATPSVWFRSSCLRGCECTFIVHFPVQNLFTMCGVVRGVAMAAEVDALGDELPSETATRTVSGGTGSAAAAAAAAAAADAAVPPVVLPKLVAFSCYPTHGE
jgi:hypothetical protein